MELQELQAIWNAEHVKLNEKLRVNAHCLNEIQQQHVKSNLSAIYWRRIIETVFHGLFLSIFIFFLINNWKSLPYLLSTGFLIILYLILFVNSIRQILLIHHINFGNDIISIQSSLAKLQAHSINLIRLLFLFLPALLGLPMIVSKLIQDYNLTWLSFMDINNGFKGNWWNVQLIGTLGWFPICLWLYLKVSTKNIHVPWVRNIIENAAGKKVANAVEYLNELTILK